MGVVIAVTPYSVQLLLSYKTVCRSLKDTGEWPVMPFTLCLLGRNLIVHSKPEKLGLLINTVDI